MFLSVETIDFFKFIIIGIIIALIFDFFRAYRKYKKVGRKVVLIQDVIFFVIVAILLIFSILKLLGGEVRVYLFIAILIGIVIYISSISKFMLKIYTKIIITFKNVLEFFLLPITLNVTLIYKFLQIFKKSIKKGCKITKNVVFNICTFIKSVFMKHINILRQKREINEKTKKGTTKTKKTNKKNKLL